MKETGQQWESDVNHEAEYSVVETKEVLVRENVKMWKYLGCGNQEAISNFIDKFWCMRKESGQWAVWMEDGDVRASWPLLSVGWSTGLHVQVDIKRGEESKMTLRFWVWKTWRLSPVTGAGFWNKLMVSVCSRIILIHCVLNTHKCTKIKCKYFSY